MINIDFKPLLILLIIVSAVGGWAIIELILWLTTFVNITFN